MTEPDARRRRAEALERKRARVAELQALKAIAAAPPVCVARQCVVSLDGGGSLTHTA